jgi:hypothetical protein
MANPTADDLSNNVFTISAATTTPTIAITSPTGGSFAAGSNVNIGWNLNGTAPANSLYYVYLKARPDQVVGGIPSQTAWTLILGASSLSSPSFSVTLPTDVNPRAAGAITPGTYYLQLDLADSRGVAISSFTTGPLTITSSTTGFSVSQSSLASISAALAQVEQQVQSLLGH